MSDYSNHYSDDSFWKKIESVGSELIYIALLLYYVLEKKETPLTAKAIIISGLGYLILPIDAIPDMLIVAGYADDLSILYGIFQTCKIYIDEDVKRKARSKVKELFGSDSPI